MFTSLHIVADLHSDITMYIHMHDDNEQYAQR